MDVALISDTHIPSRERAIPERFRERIRAADHVIHAGDFDAESTLAEIRDLGPLTAVAGNIDPELGLPTVDRVELGGVEFVVTHGIGPLQGYRDRVVGTVAEHATSDDAVAVAGHTHEPVDTHHRGVRLLNPGSVTGATPADAATMMIASAVDGTLEVTLHD